MTPDEVATTMREEAETGRSFAELAVESGRLKAEDLAKITGEDAATATPTIDPAPEPAADAHVDADVAEPVAEAIASTDVAEVFIRLTSGERIPAGTYTHQDEAEARARELMKELDGGADWPSFDGRFVRPDAVVSIDLELTGD